jgi:DNA gyrase subunit A
MAHIKAPDFPTGGIIYGYSGVRDAFETGRGRVVMRALAHIETLKNGRERIIVSELPYQVNKANLHEKIAMLMAEKKIEGIAEVRDESDRDGMRLVIEIKRDAIPKVVLNNLYKQTALQTSFSVNNVALVKGRPRILNLKDMIHYYVEHRHEVVVRRTEYDLEQARQRAHILEGLIIALDNLDAVIKLIRSSANADVAREGLMKNFELSEIQAKAILDMRLQRLTSLEIAKVKNEYEELMKKIDWLQQVLAKEELRMNIIKDELNEIATKYGDKRRTQIVHNAEEFSIEDMIANEDVVITISHQGYIKRTPLKGYRRQNRGGVGSKGSGTKEEDFVEHLYIASTHNYLLFFTEKGKCYWIKVYEIPEGSRSSKGRAIQNLIQIERDDKVLAYLNVQDLNNQEFLQNNSIIMVTAQGTVKKTLMEAYSRPRSNGIIAININEGDRLLTAQLLDNNSEVVLATRMGYAIRFPADLVRDMGRNAAGVRGVRLQGPKDEVVGMVVVRNPQTQLLVLSENGFGKRSQLEDYRITNRGGKGVKTMNITDKTGALIGIAEVNDTDDLMIITVAGIAIRMPVESIRQAGRATQGVRLIRLRDADSIAAMTKLAERDDDEALEEDDMGDDEA